MAFLILLVVLATFGKRSFLGFLSCGALEPALIVRRAETGIISRAGDKTLVVQLCAEVLGVNVRGNFPRVSGCAQETPHEFIHSNRFRTGNRDRAIHWLGKCDIGQGGGDVVCGDGLHHTRRQPDRLPFGG